MFLIYQYCDISILQQIPPPLLIIKNDHLSILEIYLDTSLKMKYFAHHIIWDIMTVKWLTKPEIRTLIAVLSPSAGKEFVIK